MNARRLTARRCRKMHDSPSRWTPSRKGRAPASISAGPASGDPALSPPRRRAAALCRAFFARSRADFGTRVPHAFAERDAGPPAARSAWRPLLTDNISPEHPRRLRRPGGAQDRTRAISSSRPRTTRPTPSRSCTRTTSSIGSHEGFVFPEGRAAGLDRDGPPRRRLLGARKWRGSATNIGCATPRAQKSNALAIGLAKSAEPDRAVARPRPAAAHRRGRQHHRTRRDAAPAADERRGDRLRTSSSTPTATAICSGRTDTQRHLAAAARRPAARAARADRRAVRAEEDRRTAAFAAAIQPLGQHAPADGALLPDAAADRGGARQLGAGQARRSSDSGVAGSDPRGDAHADLRPAPRRRRRVADRRAGAACSPTISTGRAI